MDDKRPSLSIIVPCYNEGKNIAGTIDCIKKSLKTTARFASTEILIFNDKSTDNTGEVAEALAKEHEEIRVIHNERNMGFGYNYTEGVRLAAKEYILMIPGDNEIPGEAITNIFSEVGRADLIVPYTINPEVRPLARQIISRAFVILFNALFALSLKYYNGPCVIKAELLKKVPMTTHGFAYMAAILVRLIKSGATFTEVPIQIQYRASGDSKALKPRNIMSVLSTILKLFLEIRFTHRAVYSAAPRKITETITARGQR